MSIVADQSGLLPARWQMAVSSSYLDWLAQRLSWVAETTTSVRVEP